MGSLLQVDSYMVDRQQQNFQDVVDKWLENNEKD